MAEVHEYLPDTDRFRALVPASKAAIDRLLALGADPVADWTPPRMRWIGATRSGDFPNLIGHVPVVSDRALEVLGPLLGPRIDRLAILVEGGGYTALHIRDIADCLDAEASEARWFEPGRARLIERYVFRPERLEGHHLFRIREMPKGLALLSGEAMEAIRAAGLAGLKDAPLWHS